MSYIIPDHKHLFDNHFLEPVQTEGPIQVYYLKKPNEGRMSSTYILFTPEGIVVCGDLCPRRHGVVSCIGYGVEWFGSHKSEHYLLEKFDVPRDWCHKRAILDLEEELKDIASYPDDYSETYVKKIYEVVDELKQGWIETMHDFIDELDGTLDAHDNLPGYGYNTRDASLLCAIQKRFAILYQEYKACLVPKNQPNLKSRLMQLFRSMLSGAKTASGSVLKA